MRMSAEILRFAQDDTVLKRVTGGNNGYSEGRIG